MKTRSVKPLVKLALVGLLMLAAGSAAAGATVVYSQPDSYADLPYASWDRAQVFKELDAHFALLARRLPAGQQLQVEVLDIDLAGHIWPAVGGAHDIRFLRGSADRPQIHLRYTIEAGGQVVGSGEERLTNLMYLDRSNRYSSNDSLRYEKQLLDDWFKAKVAVR